jgi:glycosyltransferase involved in cell wall biosynthesis
MPSKSETFGLVYIEALSQGLPIIFTEGEGIDGFYEKNIGEAVDANDVKSIANGIFKISNNYLSYNFDPKEIVNNHNWNNIAQKYIKNIYNEYPIHPSIF